MGTDIRASNSHSKTTDFSTGMKWRLGTSTEVTSSVQFVKATTNSLDSTVALGTNVPYIDVALNGSNPPHIGVDSDFTGNPANYYWGFTMDHQDQNYAKELAWRADIEHSFVEGFVQGVKGGVRLTNRYADNIDTGYNWMPVFQTWMQGWAIPSGALPGLDLNGTVNTSLVHLDTFNNFYRGDAGIPGAFYAPVPSTALGYPGSYADIHNAAIPYYIAGSGYDVPYQPTLLDAAHTNLQHEKTYAAYAMLDFGVDDANLSGNIGVRAVRTRNAAQGFLVYPNQTLAPYLGAGQSTPISARNQYTDILPSLNVKWEFAPNWITRFAFSKAIARPDFSQMQAYQILNAGVVSGYTPPPGTTVLPIDKLTLTGSSNSNPYLTPMKANQFDLSLEWYFDQDRGGMAWVNLFHKGISDYFRNESRFVTYPGSRRQQLPVSDHPSGERRQGDDRWRGNRLEPVLRFPAGQGLRHVGELHLHPQQDPCAERQYHGAAGYGWLHLRQPPGGWPVEGFPQCRRLLRARSVANPAGLQLAQPVSAVDRSEWLQRYRQQHSVEAAGIRRCLRTAGWFDLLLVQRAREARPGDEQPQ